MNTEGFNLIRLLTNLKDSLLEFVFVVLVIIIVFMICRLVMNIISKRTKKLIDLEKQKSDRNSKEVITSLTVTRSVIRYIVYLIGIIVILNYLGYSGDVSNVLVTAGIGGLIISLGAQSFVKDLISGIFILFEHQYAVGDYVKINEQEGSVTAISLRSTYLDYRGQKIIIPNGQVETVINYNDEYSTFVFDVPTPYEANTKKLMEIIQKVLDKYYKEHEELFVAKPEVLGISKFNDSSVDLCVMGKCKSLKHYQAERELKLLIKECFDSKHISIPYQTIEIRK